MVKARRSRRTQKGGSSVYNGGYGNYSYTGPAGVSAGGVPFESRAANNDNCGWTYRQPPQLGGRRTKNKRKNKSKSKSKSKSQRGGGCGCMMQAGGGGGTGGYGFVLNNDLGQVYDRLSLGPCPIKPTATQLGGSHVPLTDHDLLGIKSYPSGYGLLHPYNSSSANFLEPVRYDRSCMGGARRNRTRRNRK